MSLTVDERDELLKLIRVALDARYRRGRAIYDPTTGPADMDRVHTEGKVCTYALEEWIYAHSEATR